MKKSKLSLLGADLAKHKFDVHLQLADGQCRQRMFTNDESGFAELWAWLKELGVTRLRAGMEATGPYWLALAEYLYAQGVLVFVFNPAYVKAHGQVKGGGVQGRAEHACGLPVSPMKRRSPGIGRERRSIVGVEPFASVDGMPYSKANVAGWVDAYTTSFDVPVLPA